MFRPSTRLTTRDWLDDQTSREWDKRSSEVMININSLNYLPGQIRFTNTLSMVKTRIISPMDGLRTIFLCPLYGLISSRTCSSLNYSRITRWRTRRSKRRQFLVILRHFYDWTEYVILIYFRSNNWYLCNLFYTD